MQEQVVNIDRMEHAATLFGNLDQNIKMIENEYMVIVVARDSELKVAGEPENIKKQ